jgi:hypothetical protein
VICEENKKPSFRRLFISYNVAFFIDRSDGASAVGDTKDLILTFPDPDDEPLYSPVRLVLDLELCTEDDLREF